MRDKIIVITGASQGLGKASAIKLAGEGAKVVLIAHNSDELQEVAKKIGSCNGRRI